MYNLQQRHEETVTVVNEGTPSLASGGIAVITDASSVSMRMVILPDESRFREPRKEGQYQYEKLFAHVRRKEIEKAEMIPGKTKIVWNGETYKIFTIKPYTSKNFFRIAEIEMRRRLDID